MQNNQNKNTSDEYEKHVAENSGDYQVKAGKYENLIAKILCVVAAILLWFYVVVTDTTTGEKTFTGIGVDVRGTDVLDQQLGLSLISGYDFTVDVTVRGKNADINRISVDDIQAYADIKNITAAGEYSLSIHTSLPAGITVAGLSSNYITVYIDRRDTVSVPIEVITSQTIESSYTLGDPEPNFDTVNVTGPAEELSKIDHAVVKLDLGRITKTLISTGKIVLVDRNGNEINNPYIRLQMSEVTVKLPVYTYKDIPLAVEYKYGYYNDTNVAVAISPASLRVRGDPDVLENMKSIVIQQIDEKKITEDTTQSVPIMLSDDIENVSGIKTATITINHKNTQTREIVVNNLIVSNPNNLSYKLESSSINVRFRGTMSFLQLLNSNNVTAKIDLGYLNNTSGTVSVPVTVSVTDALAGNVYEIGEYKIDVNIS